MWGEKEEQVRGLSCWCRFLKEQRSVYFAGVCMSGGGPEVRGGVQSVISSQLRSDLILINRF